MVLLIALYWLHGKTIKHAAFMLGLNRKTVAQYWRKFNRIVKNIINLNADWIFGANLVGPFGGVQLGGANIIVQLDEHKFARRKYNVGRIMRGAWCFGIIDPDHPEAPFVIDLGLYHNRRDRHVLLPLIARHVRVGSTIYPLQILPHHIGC